MTKPPIESGANGLGIHNNVFFVKKSNKMEYNTVKG